MSSDRKLPGVRLIGASAEKIQSDDRTVGLWTLLAPHTIVVLHQTLAIDAQPRGCDERRTSPVGVFAPRTIQQELGKFAVLEANQFPSPAMTDRITRLPAGPLLNFDREAAKAVRELGELAAESRIVVLCQREAEADRLRELLKEHAPEASITIDL